MAVPQLRAAVRLRLEGGPGVSEPPEPRAVVALSAAVTFSCYPNLFSTVFQQLLQLSVP